MLPFFFKKKITAGPVCMNILGAASDFYILHRFCARSAIVNLPKKLLLFHIISNCKRIGEAKQAKKKNRAL
jgi:hypothetical protein